MTQARFHFVTLFPELIEPWLKTSILGRAHAAGIFDFRLYPLRDYSTDKHRSVDDTAYGGGGGMVLRIEPLVAAVESIRAAIGAEPSLSIYFSPAGKTMSQALFSDWANSPYRHFILICGRYEGVDQRFIDHWVDTELSMGDFVLTGGELPALAFADALTRQWEGVLGCPGGEKSESFSIERQENPGVLLEYPHYTRPPEFRGLKVPKVLLSGDHGEIEKWRYDRAVERTETRRPDLLG